jgi:HEAT repeat protein
VTNLTRWKLATALFAAVAVLATASAWTGDRPTGRARPAVTSASSPRSLPAQYRRPIRISAAAVGMSERELIDRILASRSTNEISLLCGKLGTVGSDEAVMSLAGMVDDHRQGVPESVLSAFGNIGTERAVDLLVELSDDDRPRIRGAAIGALGASQAARAEAVLTKIAKDRSDPMQSSAVYALSSLGSDAAADTLAELALDADWNTTPRAPRCAR